MPSGMKLVERRREVRKIRWGVGEDPNSGLGFKGGEASYLAGSEARVSLVSVVPCSQLMAK